MTRPTPTSEQTKLVEAFRNKWIGDHEEMLDDLSSLIEALTPPEGGTVSDEMVEKVARAICEAGTAEPGLCFRDDDPHEVKCVRSCVGCRNVARAAIATIDKALLAVEGG